jgi:CRISPR-associated protein Csy3
MLEETRNTLVSFAEKYRELNGFDELARRISKNILMGKWVWRNRTCRSLSIKVQTSDSQTLTVDKAFRLSWQGEWPAEAQGKLELLTKYLAKGLSDPTDLYYLDVTAKLDIGSGDEVYPSQEFLDGKQENEPSKQLAKAMLNGEQETAVFHSQKIGAALQSIDDWWAEGADKPLRVNEYGADREYLIARRHPKNGNDFYQLVSRAENWIQAMEESESIPDDVHYIMAVLVKANVFNNRRA